MKYDAIIIGSGQAGNPLAAKLAESGAHVALIEQEHLGGTCVNTGCTPTKTLVQRAQVAHYAMNSSRWGVSAYDVSVDISKVMAQKDKVVKEWQESVKEEISGNTVDLFWGHAKFTGPHSVQVGDHELESDQIFINAGASPSIPKIAGLADTPFLTNESILQLEVIPETLTVIGGGYIGLEFGQMFCRFGSKVTIIQSAPQIVPREDPEVAEQLQNALKSEGVDFLLGAAVDEIRFDEHFQISIVGHPSLSSSHLLVATGRNPNTADLGLDVAGVKTDVHGAIIVDDRLQTNVQGIWALGDVKGGPAFTHISYNDFQVVSDNLLNGESRSIKDRIVPYCVFTNPQLAGFGMTEKEARQSGRQLKIGSIPMSKVARAVEIDETAGLMKLIIDAKTDEILGATILGVEAGELIHILYAVAMAKQPYTLLKDFIFIHPTLAEGIFSLVASVK